MKYKFVERIPVIPMVHLCVPISRNVRHVPALLATNFKELIYMHYMTRYQWNVEIIPISLDYGKFVIGCMNIFGVNLTINT